MFNYTKLHIFDKNGTEVPIEYSSGVRIHISSDLGEPALFYAVSDSEKNITDAFKVNSGKFRGRSSALTARISTITESFTESIGVDMGEIQSSNPEPYYCVNAINCGDIKADIDGVPFPSVTFSGKIQFDKVSTSLVETQTLYVLAEDSDGNLIKPHFIQDEEWKRRYKLLCFIDCRVQDDFRFFKVNADSDEVVWSDRALLDFADENSFRIHLGFSGKNEGVYEEPMYFCLIDTDQATENEGDLGEVIPVGEFKMYAETEGEDERYRTLFTDFGIPDPKLFNDVYKDSAVGDDLMDNISLNRHSKEMFLSYSEIFPYAGTYKALIKAVRLLGYDDVFFKEWYKILGSGRDTHSGYMAYDMPYGNAESGRTISSVPLEQRIKLRKLNWLSMMYYINKEIIGGQYDRFGFPETISMYTYYDESMLVKLISLREWLEKYILGLNCRIIDIGGEGIYFERYKNDTYGGFQQHIEYEKSKNVTLTVIDKSVILEDASALIGVRIGSDETELTVEDCVGKRFEDFCDGYLDASRTYKGIETLRAEEPSFIYVGKTVGGYDNDMCFFTRASGATESFMFSEGYIDENSPRVMVSGSRIYFDPNDLTGKGMNSAFTNLPIIMLERAYLKAKDATDGSRVKYKVYPVYGNEYSYCIENVFTGEKRMTADYVSLVPPTYTDNGDSVSVTSKSGISVEVSKRTNYPDLTDASFGSADYVYNKNMATYGLRYSADNSKGSPVFSILGYEVRKNADISDPVLSAGEELVIDILDGKMAFYESENDRYVYLNFHMGKNNTREIEVNCVYESEETFVCLYEPSGESQPFRHFIRGRKYDEFAETYENDTEKSMLFEHDKVIKVNNTGIFNIDVFGKDLQNNVFAAKANEYVNVYMAEPHLTALSNNPVSNNDFGRSGRLLSDGEKESVSLKYLAYNINEYIPRSGNLSVDGNSVSFPVYPNNSNLQRFGKCVHMINLTDRFNVLSSSYATDESGLVSKYDIVLDKPYDDRVMRTAGKNDKRAVSYIYTGSADSSSYTPANTGYGIIMDASTIDTLNVHAVLYNELGQFPVLQTGAKLICEGLASGSAADTHYHLIIENDNTATYRYDGSVSKDNISIYEKNGKPVYLKDPETGIDSMWMMRTPAETSTVMDSIGELLAEPYMGLYVYPDWKAEIKIQGISESRVYVSFINDIYPRAFKPGEMVKLIFTVKDRPEYIAQSSYKVIGYDSLGFVLILEGEISGEFVSKPYKKYAYAEMPYTVYEQGLYNVDTYNWTPSEKEDEEWINGWLCYRETTESDTYTTVFTHTCHAHGDMTEHTHKYRIPAGKYTDKDGHETIRYRVFSHDDIGCKSGEKEDAMFNPYWEIGSSEFDTDLYISYAHNIFVDYEAAALNVDSDFRQAKLEMASEPLTRKKLYFMDDTFKIDVRPYNYYNGVTYWMRNENGTPLLCEENVYSYNCPINLIQGKSAVMFSADMDSMPSEKETSQVMWQVYKAVSGSDRRLLFESWNSDLFLDLQEPGIYDLGLTVFDKYGNRANRLFEGAVRISDLGSETPVSYKITVNGYSVYDGDENYGVIDGGGEYFENELCMLTALPAEGHAFLGWFIDGVRVSEKRTYSFYVDSDMTLTAKFEPFILTVNASVFAGSENYGEIECVGGLGDGTFYYGTDCTVISTPYAYQAHPDVYYVFEGLYPDETAENKITDSSVFAFRVTSDIDLYAKFSRRMFSVSVTSNNTELGTVTGNGLYEAGDTAVISANSERYGEFKYWSENDRRLEQDPSTGDTADSSAYTIGEVLRNYNVTGIFKSTILDVYRLRFKMDPHDAFAYYDIYVNGEQVSGNSYDGSFGDILNIDASYNGSGGLNPYALESVTDDDNNRYDISDIRYTLRKESDTLLFRFKNNQLAVNASIHVINPQTDPRTYGAIRSDELIYGGRLSIYADLEDMYEPDYIVVNGSSYPMLPSGENTYRYTQDGVTESVTAVLYCKIKKNYEPFCVHSESGNTQLRLLNAGSVRYTYKYSTDSTESWQNWETPYDTSILIPEGTSVYICARDINRGCAGTNSSALFYDSSVFSYSVSGNLISLLYSFGHNYDSVEMLAPRCFAYMFHRLNSLKDASSLIMPVNLEENCFDSMFKYTHITESPDLRAEDGENNCYANMFYGCHELDKVTVRLNPIHVYAQDPYQSDHRFTYPYTKDWLAEAGTAMSEGSCWVYHTDWNMVQEDYGNNSCIPRTWKESVLP